MNIPLPGEAGTFEPQDAGDLGASNIQKGSEMAASGFEQAGNTMYSQAKFLSRTMMIQQQANFSQAANDARTAILIDPSDANVKSQQAALDGMKTTSDGVTLMSRDQAILTRNMNSSEKSFNFQADATLARNNNRQLQLSFEQNLPSSIQDIHNELINGTQVPEKPASDLAQSLIDQANDLQARGIISPTEATRTRGLVNTAVQRAAAISQNPSGFTSDPMSIAHEQSLGFMQDTQGTNPQNPSSQMATSLLSNAMNENDAKADAIGGKFPMDYYLSASDAQASNIQQVYGGASQAHAAIVTGLHYDVMQSQLSQLNKMKGLSGMQDGYKAVLSNTANNIKNNYFDYFTAQTNEGKNALQTLNNNLSDYKNSAILSDDAKQRLSNQAQQQFTNQSIAYAHAHGIPTQYVKPFSPNDPSYQAVLGGFNPQGDTSSALQVLHSGNVKVPYMINAIPSGTQQEAAQLSALSGDVGLSTMMLNANQNVAAGTTPLKLTDNSSGKMKVINDDDIATALAGGSSGYSDYVNHVSNIPGGTDRMGSIQTSVTNAVKYCMASNPNNGLDKCVQTVNGIFPGSDDYQKGNVTGSTNYNFLKPQFSIPVSDTQAEGLANLVYDKVQNNFIAQAKSANISDYQRKLNLQNSLNGVVITNTPAHTVIAYNPNTGKTLMEMPVNSDTLVLAQHQYLADHQDRLGKGIAFNLLAGTLGGVPQELRDAEVDSHPIDTPANIHPKGVAYSLLAGTLGGIPDELKEAEGDNK